MTCVSLEVVAFSLCERIRGEGATNHSPFVLFFLPIGGDQLSGTNSTPKASISPQWLNELR